MIEILFVDPKFVDPKFDDNFFCVEANTSGLIFWFVGEIKYYVFIETEVAVFERFGFLIYSAPFIKLNFVKFFGVLIVFLVNEV